MYSTSNGIPGNLMHSKYKITILIIVAASVVALVFASLAADLRHSVNWHYEKGLRKRTLGNENYKTNVTGNAVIENVQKIYSTNAALVLGSVDDPGFMYARNLGLDTNSAWIDIGTRNGTNFHPFVRLKGGQSMQAWISSNAPHAKINPRSKLDMIELDYFILNK